MSRLVTITLTMKIRTVLKENWLLKKIPEGTFLRVLFLLALVFCGSNLYLRDWLQGAQWMPASAEEVFGKHEYWRLWTTLFAHGDATHLFSNMLLFFPFAYFLVGTYGLGFFPIFGWIAGGIINAIVLKTMPSSVHLIGMSGVVYWMGAAWAILAYLIDRREKRSKRLLKVIGASAILFLPETYQPDVSYLTHFIGYLVGLLSGYAFYFWNRRKFHAAEVYELRFEYDDEDFPIEEHSLGKTGSTLE